jgi:hypothetical protein
MSGTGTWRFGSRPCVWHRDMAREDAAAWARLEGMLDAILILVPVLALAAFLVAAARTVTPRRPAI